MTSDIKTSPLTNGFTAVQEISTITPPSDEVLTLINAIHTSRESYLGGDSKVRSKLLKLSRALTSALEAPEDALQRIRHAEPARNAAIKVSLDLGIFELLSDEPISVAEVSSKTGADAILVGRIMRHLAAMDIIGESGADLFTSTSISSALVNPNMKSGMKHSFEVVAPIFQHLPAYLARTKYVNPENPNDTAFQFTHQTPLKLFPWMQERPSVLAGFKALLKSRHKAPRTWIDVYPVEERLIAGLKEGKEEILLVDVGGNVGSDLKSFGKRCHGKGNLVLQDLPAVMKRHELGETEGLQAMAYDFFTPQPILGARAYYLSKILHDWNDSDSRQILKNQAAAMQKDYSKLLIQDFVIPNEGASCDATRTDMVMMACNAAKERTESQWRELLGSVGLKIVKVWEVVEGQEGLIEAELF